MVLLLIKYWYRGGVKKKSIKHPGHLEIYPG
jgi:hypothetical protein